MRLLRWLVSRLTGALPALFVLGLVVAMALPAVVAHVAPDRAHATVTLANVTHADVVSVALAAVLVAVVFLTFAAANPRARYLLTHAVPRRYVTTYGVELAGESYPELATWRQWGSRISDHRTYRLAATSTA